MRTTFVNLYRKGLIYRRERIVNWCPRCATALSDLEVKHAEESAAIYHIRYNLADGGAVTIATTRPETLLGDTAVAVNPADARYAHLVGRSAVLPVLGRVIPVIADEAVSTEFGTGALKVTPGHDHNDFEIGERHGLPTVNIMHADGTLNEQAGHYEGKDRLAVRKQIVEELERDGLLELIEPYRHSVGHCDRCGEVVEPMVSKQWYMKMKPLAEPAIDAVRSGEVRIVPERFTKVYYNWMENIRDWCVSRQLWWGHRLPGLVLRRLRGRYRRYGGPHRLLRLRLRRPDARPGRPRHLVQPPPLWPHSTLGWPRDTEDMSYFYPTSDMETGHDILFFWIARMMMMGIENTGEVPFRTIYLHGLVRDPAGVKMSKSKGNVMDPLDLIDLYGADALRFALTTGNSPGNDMRLNEARMEASRNFANKLWNAARFVMTNLDSAPDGPMQWPPKPVHLHDRWIVSRLNGVVAEVQRHMRDYQFGEAQRAVHDFLWGEYCDWYLEMSKIRLRSEEDGADSPLPVMACVLEELLRLLHPFMPFITEEIWQKLVAFLPSEPDRTEALIAARYPESDPARRDEHAEAEVGAMIELVRAVRNVRAEFRIDRNQPLEAVVDGDEIARVAAAESAVIQRLAGVDSLKIGRGGTAPASDEVSVVLTKGAVAVPLGGLVDLDHEKKRLSEEMTSIDGNLQKLGKRLQDEKFLEPGARRGRRTGAPAPGNPPGPPDPRRRGPLPPLVTPRQ